MLVSTAIGLCTLQAVPCLLLAFIAKPGTNHKLIFRVRHAATASIHSQRLTAPLLAWHTWLLVTLQQCAIYLRILFQAKSCTILQPTAQLVILQTLAFALPCRFIKMYCSPCWGKDRVLGRGNEIAHMQITVPITTSSQWCAPCRSCGQCASTSKPCQYCHNCA